MATTTTEWQLRLKDGITPELAKVISSVQKFEQGVMKTFDEMSKRSVNLFASMQNFQMMNTEIQSMIEPGRKLNREMGELASMVKLTDGQMKMLEATARSLAKTYGGDAADAATSMQQILSATTPELAKYPQALKAITSNATLMSKTMRGDVVGATEAMVTAMNAYEVSFKNPNEAAAKSIQFLDMITKGALVGSATVPSIASALQVLGSTASVANVKFYETQAALQLLDQKGLKAAQGGTALRNILLKLGEGRFLPKDTREALQSAGVDIAKLSNNALPLADRLGALNKVPQDLLSKMFGVENISGAQALIRNIGTLRTWSSEIANTSKGATQQAAAAVMDTYDERMARFKARMDDFKIGFFNATQSVLPLVQVTSGLGVTIMALAPAISGVSKLLAWMKLAMLGGATATGQARLGLLGYTRQLWANRMATLGNVQATALMASSRIVSFLATLAGMLRLATLQQWLLNVALNANPIGLAVLAIGALIGAVALVVTKWDVLKGYFIAFGKFLWNVFLYSNPIGWMILGFQKLLDMFPVLGDFFNKIWDGIVSKVKGFIDMLGGVWNTFKDLLGFGGAEVKTSAAGNAGSASLTTAAGETPMGTAPAPTSIDTFKGGSTGGGSERKSVIVNMGGVQIMPHAQLNSGADVMKLKQLITEIMVAGVRDAELILST